MTEVEILSQLVNSMADAVDKLEGTKRESKISDFNKIKEFILKIQKKIKGEINA